MTRSSRSPSNTTPVALPLRRFSALDSITVSGHGEPTLHPCFAEVADGLTLQSDLQRLAREGGIRICGPNCLGIANLADNVWASSNPNVEPDVVPKPGSVALLSQSGATAFGPLMALARDRGVGLRYIVSTGNEADLEVADFAEFMLEDEPTKSVALLIEGVHARWRQPEACTKQRDPIRQRVKFHLFCTKR